MNLQPVSSSRMSHVGWENDTMYIQFLNGAIYAYHNVTHAEYVDFINSPSLGHELVAFQQRHPYSRIR